MAAPGAPRTSGTLDSMPIFMMVPTTVRTSLMTRRMYQPLRNSMRSERHTLWLYRCWKNRLNSCVARRNLHPSHSIPMGKGPPPDPSSTHPHAEVGMQHPSTHMLEQQAPDDGASAEDEGQGADEDDDDIEEEPEEVVTYKRHRGSSQHPAAPFWHPKRGQMPALWLPPRPKTLGSLHSLMSARLSKRIFTRPL